VHRDAGGEQLHKHGTKPGVAADDLPALAELNGEGSYKSMSASGLPGAKSLDERVVQLLGMCEGHGVP